MPKITSNNTNFGIFEQQSLLPEVIEGDDDLAVIHGKSLDKAEAETVVLHPLPYPQIHNRRGFERGVRYTQPRLGDACGCRFGRSRERPVGL